MQRSSLVPVLTFLVLVGLHSSALACDLCAVYSARRASAAPTGSFQLGLVERFTRFSGKARGFLDQGDSFRSEQSLNSSITQFYLNYNLSDLVSLQVSYPWIYREYKRVVDGLVEDGDEFGFGDLALLAKLHPLSYQSGSNMFFMQTYVGVKLPTGDTDRLQEEEEAEQRIVLRHSSGSGALVGGDDLTIGTGSTDALFGFSIFAEHDKLFLDSDFQYALRTEGDSDFEFGDGISWSFGPGVYLYTEHSSTVSFRVKLSGESKQDDKLIGRRVAGSAHDRVFLGPELIATSGENLHFSLGIDLPIKRNSSSQGVEPDYRLHAKLSYWY